MRKDVDRNYRNLQPFEFSLQQGKWTPGFDSKLGCPIVINLNLKVMKLDKLENIKKKLEKV